MNGTRYVNAAFGAALATLAACTINPVTGNRELALISADQEIEIGQQQYGPSQQMQGGDYSFDPALTAYVRGVGTKLAAVSDRALPYEFVVLNSSVPNAWALPGGKIAVNRGLLTELHSEAELAAVLGHEIVHAAARHGAIAMQRGLLLGVVVSGMQSAARGGNFAGLAVGAAGVGAQLISQRNGRENELEADQYGMQYMSRAGYDPSAAVTLQETFVRLSQQNGGDQGRLAALFASHPPSTERVEKNRATAATLPKGGDMGRERYQAATAALRQRQPAYDAYDKGRAALAENKPADAERFAQEATRLLPAEAQFHALLGDIATTRRRGTSATPSGATSVSSTTTCKRVLRIGNCASGTRRAPSSNAACSCCLPRTPTTRSARWRSSAATAQPRSRTMGARRNPKAPPVSPRRTRPCASICRRIPANTSRRAARSTATAS
jgi:predicted Zn-dependent protease